jgi:exosome complex exonuclease RRP6
VYKLEEYAEYEDDVEFCYPHPYEHELTELQYLDKQLVATKETPPGTLEGTPFTWVDTVPQLEKLVALLDKEEEFAVDLESHSYRSFQGFTCLMQISTRKEDFVIDTLSLRSKMNLLNSSFTNPKIVKVLHGSDSDVVWLQRDFGIYLVNLFDTGQATRVLEFPKFSLAYLLSYYCNVLADKKYQLADWRIRPIPEEMLRYAREDTHYLLYIYDKLKNELIAHGNQNNNLLLSVLNRSRDLCLKRYEKEKFTRDSHLILYNKFNLTLNSVQMKVFAGLFKWRDTVAREQDESVRFVLPNHMLFKISEVLPSDPSALLQCCSPIPPLVKTYTMEILSIINEAKKEKLTATTPTNNSNFASPLKDLSSTISSSSSGMYQSPVLTTDQLYTAAGWLEDNEFHWTPRSKYSIVMPTSNENYESNVPFVTTLFLNSYKEDEEDEEDEQQQIYRDKVAKIQSSISDTIINPQLPPELLKSLSQPPASTEEKKQQPVATLNDVKEEEPLPQSMAEVFIYPPYSLLILFIDLQII